jgi:hypothetical protein
MTIWSILLQLEIFYSHLVYFMVIWYNFPRFDILDQEKSGNPAREQKKRSQNKAGWSHSGACVRVARFFLVEDTKTSKNIPKCTQNKPNIQKIFPMAVK